MRGERSASLARTALPGLQTCQTHSRAYLRHLIKSGEALGARLASLHNLRFYMSLLEQARVAIAEGRFDNLHKTVEELSDRRV